MRRGEDGARAAGGPPPLVERPALMPLLPMPRAPPPPLNGRGHPPSSRSQEIPRGRIRPPSCRSRRLGGSSRSCDTIPLLRPPRGGRQRKEREVDPSARPSMPPYGRSTAAAWEVAVSGMRRLAGESRRRWRTEGERVAGEEGRCRRSG
jgi:hypothetical protein